MKPDPESAVSIVHRLLFQALLDIREQAQQQRDKVSFHLADLFHNVVLEMEAAARGGQSFDEVLGILQERASERGLDRWLAASLARDADRRPERDAS